MRTRRPIAILVMLTTFTIGLAACAGPFEGGATSGRTPPPAQVPPTAAPTATATQPPDTTTPPIASGGSSGYAVNVYFSRHPDSDNNPALVFPVHRTAPTLGVATYAIRQLIAGPTSGERSAGYYSPLGGVLTGASSCGADFTIALNTHANRPEHGTATLRFCRETQLPGELTGGYIKAEIERTLLQFPTIKKVIILSADGSCFDDLSGQNRCLN